MYYVYLIALSAFICAVVLGGIAALLFTVIPYKGLKRIGSHTEKHYDSHYWENRGLSYSYEPYIQYREDKVIEVDDYGLGIVMPIKSKNQVEKDSTSRLLNTCALSVFSAAMLLASIISGIVGGVNMARAEADYYRYSDIYTMYYTMYDDEQGFANIGYTQQVISYNDWLVEARANLETFGKHSKWYEYDLYSINYITMRGGE